MTTVVAVSAAVIAACYAAALIALAIAIAQSPPICEPAELSAADEELVAEAAARMKQYGAAVADYYDTEGTL
jgi:hypothetical protein